MRYTINLISIIGSYFYNLVSDFISCVNFTKGGFFVKITYVKEVIHSSKRNEDFYAIRLVLMDDKGNVIAKEKNVSLWLTKEQYESLKI